jgi:hypothetical protein
VLSKNNQRKIITGIGVKVEETKVSRGKMRRQDEAAEKDNEKS